MPTEQRSLTPTSNSYPVLGDLRDYPWVNELDLVKSPDDATMRGTVVYAGTIPDLADNFSIILGGYVVGTEADLRFGI